MGRHVQIKTAVPIQVCLDCLQQVLLAARPESWQRADPVLARGFCEVVQRGDMQVALQHLHAAWPQAGQP
ncbi:hypothetical protein D9M72_611780 [compost metagenome]